MYLTSAILHLTVNFLFSWALHGPINLLLLMAYSHKFLREQIYAQIIIHIIMIRFFSTVEDFKRLQVTLFRRGSDSRQRKSHYTVDRNCDNCEHAHAS